MASWMVHLRIADILLKEIPGLSAQEFLMGNIAPDSGIPTADGITYTPSKQVSHYQYIPCPEGKDIDLEGFIQQYFTKQMQTKYSIPQKSFYLGYLCHLITDIDWLLEIYRPTMRQFSSLSHQAWLEKVRQVKNDWYDLDFLFLRKHPHFPAFEIFRNTVGFQNTFMDEFSPDAFDKRRRYISEFYEQNPDHLDRVYPYLTEERSERFIQESVENIRTKLKQYLQ